jgi:hypothetical protein
MMVAKREQHARCAICAHPERALIEAGHVAGVSTIVTSAKYGMSRRAIFRHMKNHVTPEERAEYLADVPLAKLAERAAEEGVSLLDYVAIVRKTLMDALLTAHALRDSGAVARLASKMVEILRLQGELAGDLSKFAVRIRNTSNTTTVVNTAVFVGSPLFAKMQRMFVERLAPFPGALEAVTDGFAELDRQETAVAAPPGGASVRAVNGEAGSCLVTCSAHWLRRCGRTGPLWRVPSSCRPRAIGLFGCCSRVAVSARRGRAPSGAG